MAFTLPPLPYAYNALEPYIDEETMRIHHTKHHQAYIDNLNKALEGSAFAGKSIEEIIKSLDSLPENIRTAVRNNGGGYVNHNLFWEIMSPDGGGQPSGELAQAIDAAMREPEEACRQRQARAEAHLCRSSWDGIAASMQALIAIELEGMECADDDN